MFVYNKQARINMKNETLQVNLKLLMFVWYKSGPQWLMIWYLGS